LYCLLKPSTCLTRPLINSDTLNYVDSKAIHMGALTIGNLLREFVPNGNWKIIDTETESRLAYRMIPNLI